MGIEKDIKQKYFSSEYEKALINISYTYSWLNQKLIPFFKEYGLTAPQFNVLRILRGQYPNPAKVNLLIDRMLDKNSNVSRIVDKLEQKDLVVRKKSENDGRAVDVFISEEGLRLLALLDDKMEEFRTSIKNLTEEESKVLNELLDRMRGD